MNTDEYFEGNINAQRLFEAVNRVMLAIGPAEVRVTKSQISFRRKKAFAWLWRPGKYLRGRKVAPLVLTIGLRRRIPSNRWKEIAEPHPGRFTHHMELHSRKEIDDEVRAWLQEAWEEAV